ncbi:RDD family protein [Kallotenue papyrolyticum]|uniref:RDD family protein n=1 Tax=Kallotenue papyrolyticum TaxID=1325125 RepID=UPI000472C03F|nr:RDD family protein [Kallotenue papyrolyticum]
MDDQRFYTIDTPEQIAVEFDVAGLGSRILAALIDHLSIAVLLGLAGCLVIFAADWLSFDIEQTLVLVSIFAIGISLVLCGYFIFFETFWNGQTPGKRLLGLRMVRVGGRPLGFLGSVLRNVIRLIDFLPAFYALGLLVMFVDRRSRRLGDIAAGAIAVRERGALTLESLTQSRALPPPVPPATQITIPNLQVLRREDYELLVEFLQRRRALSPEARSRLAHQLVAGLELRLGVPIELVPPATEEQFLQQVVAEYQALHRRASPAGA